MSTNKKLKRVGSDVELQTSHPIAEDEPLSSEEELGTSDENFIDDRTYSDDGEIPVNTKKPKKTVYKAAQKSKEVTEKHRRTLMEIEEDGEDSAADYSPPRYYPKSKPEKKATNLTEKMYQATDNKVFDILRAQVADNKLKKPTALSMKKDKTEMSMQSMNDIINSLLEKDRYREAELAILRAEKEPKHELKLVIPKREVQDPQAIANELGRIFNRYHSIRPVNHIKINYTARSSQKMINGVYQTFQCIDILYSENQGATFPVFCLSWYVAEEGRTMRPTSQCYKAGCRIISAEDASTIRQLMGTLKEAAFIQYPQMQKTVEVDTKPLLMPLSGPEFYLIH